ncbi:Protein NRT1/ PTR FAMILY 1.2 [Quillaja saponaria]|uniref:Protein NRT1/ PTR FAMILY 1.2 n=1 Tax=Quillaja saponaria TaxID=32244 RepID=A0AAD7L6Z1_QUISA|nr:Protein NRT1/ PTR FAMILY 1.2 [Quillaja saponaria]
MASTMETKAEPSAVTSDQGELGLQQVSVPEERKKGGLKVMPFIIANEAFASLATTALSPNMIQYLMQSYNLGVAKGTNILFLWNGGASFMPFVGAFVADSYLGRFLAISIGSIFNSWGCLFYGLLFLATIFFFIASALYVKAKASSSLLTGFAQVLVAAFKNRKLTLPPQNSDGIGVYHHQKDSKLHAPTDKIRFLNKANVIKNPELDIAPDGSVSNPWSFCTIEQVEELKTLIKVIPIWSTGIMMSVNHSQGSFPLLQAKTMDRHVTSSFQIPPGSFVMFMIFSPIIWILLYDRVLLSLASKIRGKPVRISTKNRIGIGLFISCLSIVASALVEMVRRRKAIKEGHLNNPQALVNMSAMWLVPHHALGGIAEAFNRIGQNEFYYSEFPETMSSISVAITGLSGAASCLITSFILNIVNDVTSRGGKESWSSDNINKGHYDRYYWVLVILSAGNVLYFCVCGWAYGPVVQKGSKASEESKEEDLTDLHT